MIIVQSPLRVSFFGGGTDMPSYYLAHRGCVLSSTINKYIFVTVKRRFDDKIRVGYTKTEMVDHIDQIKHDLIREALRMTEVTRGIEITTMGDIPSAGSGLGSSSTVTVGVLQALYSFRGEIVTADRLAQEACKIEIDILDKPIGIQDQIIAAYGGLRFMEFETDGQVKIDELRLPLHSIKELNENLLLFYTGIPRSADNILSEQETNIPSRLDVLSEMKQLAMIAREKLERGNIEELGHMLHYGWNLKKKLASKITNPRIDEMYQSARRAGALGGKITGAGGGGFLLLFCPRETQADVRNALHHLRELPFKLEREGVKPIFNYPRSENGIEEQIQRQFTGLKIGVPGRKAGEGKNSMVNTYSQSEVEFDLDIYISDVSDTISKLPLGLLDRIVKILHSARIEGRSIYIMGNGGSATTATHFACDLNKNLRFDGFPDFIAHSLTDNIAMFSAYANDEGYESVFSRQLLNSLRDRDIVIAISTSGNSPNVLRAIEFAIEKGAVTIGFTGFNGGQLKKLVDLNINVDNDCIEQIEDIHLMLEHMIIVGLKKLRERSLDRKVETDMGADLEALIPMKEGDGSQPLIEVYNEESPGNGHGSKAELYYELHREMMAPRPVGELLSEILKRTLQFMGAVTGSLLFVDEDQNLSGGMVFYKGKLEERDRSDLAEIAQNGLARWVVQNKLPVIVDNTSEDSRWLKRRRQDTGRAAVLVPIFINGCFFGILSLSRQKSARFSASDINLLSGIGVIMSLNGVAAEFGNQVLGGQQSLPLVE